MILDWIYTFIFTVGAFVTLIAGYITIAYLVWRFSPSERRERELAKERDELWLQARLVRESQGKTRIKQSWDEFRSGSSED